jgi:poly(beta-D-mannuronate) lyase
MLAVMKKVMALLPIDLYPKKMWVFEWEIIEITDLYVEAGINTLSEAVEMIGAQDTIFLTTSGGIYEVEDNIAINKKVTIVADTDEMPTIIRTTNNYPNPYLFEMKATGELHLDGVILDGSENSAKALIASSPNGFSQYYRVKLNNCVLQNVDRNGEGNLFLANAGTKADSLIFTNCKFTNSVSSAFKLTDEEEGSGLYNASYLGFENCTFWNIDAEVFDAYGGDDNVFSFGPAIIVDHCTFYNCGNNGATVMNLIDVDLATITNSIFSNCSEGTSPIKLYGWSYIEYCDLFNTDSLELYRGANAKDGMV